MDPHFEGLDPHASESLHVLQALHDHSAFEHKQHAESEETEVPVLIHEPQTTAEDLEHKERSY